MRGLSSRAGALAAGTETATLIGLSLPVEGGPLHNYTNLLRLGIIRPAERFVQQSIA